VTVDEGVLPPTSVRLAFAVFLGDVVLSLLNAVIQVSVHLSGATVLVGAVIEAVLFIGLGVRMRAGRLWARVTLMSVSFVFVAVGVLAVIGLDSAFGHQVDGLVWFALICVAVKLVLIVAGTVLMYRPGNALYFR
jgi:hypothetical protein